MNNNKRNFLIQNKAISLLEIKLDRLDMRAATIQEKVNVIEKHWLENDVKTVKPSLVKPEMKEITDLRAEIKNLNQKLDILQGIAVIILVGIIINLFSKPLLSALS